MIRFINKLTGGDMWVHESRVGEYKAAGHVPAADLQQEKSAEKAGTAARRSGKAQEPKGEETTTKQRAETAGKPKRVSKSKN